MMFLDSLFERIWYLQYLWDKHYVLRSTKQMQMQNAKQYRSHLEAVLFNVVQCNTNFKKALSLSLI